MSQKSCECCLMPLAKDVKLSGSEKYCSYCYADGRLHAEGKSLKEFQRCSYEGMRKNGINPLMAWFFSQMIRFAPYWKARNV